MKKIRSPPLQNLVYVYTWQTSQHEDDVATLGGRNIATCTWCCEKKQSPAIPSCRNESSNSCLVVLDNLTKFSTNQRPTSSQHVGYVAKWGIKSIAA